MCAVTKNVTVSVTDELAKKMERMPEVNWSEVCRRAISEYIEARESKERGEVIEDLERYLKSKLPKPKERDPIRNAEIERFTRKWGRPDRTFPDDSPGAQPPYISLQKVKEIKHGDRVLVNLRIFNRPMYKPEQLSAFNIDQWKDFAHGKIEYIVDSFKSKGFTVGERELRLVEIGLLLTDGDKHRARDQLESYFTSGLFAIDKEDTVCIAIRQVKR